MKIIQDIIEKAGDFTTGFFVGSFSAIAKENRDKFWKRVFPLLRLFSPWEGKFIKMFNESGRGSDSGIRAQSTDRWFS